MNAQSLTQALGGRWHGSYGTARCPAHDDRAPTLLPAMQAHSKFVQLRTIYWRQAARRMA